MDQDERGHDASLSRTDCDDGVVVTREALAHRVGVAVGDVDRLVDAGLIIPDDATNFTGGDVWRTRFLLGLEQGGVSLEAVAKASGAATSPSSSSTTTTGIGSAA